MSGIFHVRDEMSSCGLYRGETCASKIDTYLVCHICMQLGKETGTWINAI